MITTRVRSLKIIFFIVIAVLLGRLSYIGVVRHNEWAAKAANQQEVKVVVEKSRGDIYDRNMTPLTRVRENNGAILLPGMVEDFQNTAAVLSELCGINQAEALQRLNTPLPERFEFLPGKSLPGDIPGLEPFSEKVRYGDESLARHIVGYLNSADHLGAAGIEKSFDRILQNGGLHQLSFVGDALRRILPGLGITADAHSEGIGLKLTLDYALQAEAERLADEQMGRGAILVADVESGDILAMVSRPNFDQRNIKHYVGGDGTQLINRALSAYDAGSVFKIVTAAAAIESGRDIYTPLYECGGEILVADAIMGCHRSDGHGMISLWSGFEQSCNPAFIKVGQDIGGRRIVNMAARLGFGRTAGLFDGSGETAGYIPLDIPLREGDTANLSIGQGRLLVTPLQVLGMTMTVANDGVSKRINLVNSIVDEYGSTLSQIKYSANQRVLDEHTAKILRGMMRGVTVNGTGANASLEDIGGAGGKTGSAQTGWRTDGESGAHAWFTGFFPAESPRYAITVLVEHGRRGNTAAAPIFSAIARFLHDQNI